MNTAPNSISRICVRLIIVSSFLILSLPAFSQSVIMQGFYWNSSPGDITSDEGVWWDSLAAAADELAAAGFTTVWTPPANKGFAGIYDMGYGTYDYFDLGEFDQKGTIRTRHGSKAQLQAMINALHAAGIEVMADVVLNHRAGAENQEPEDCDDGNGQQLRYTDFDPLSGRLPMNAPHFHPNAFPGHCNLFGPYHDRTFFEDVCYFNFMDQELLPSEPNDGWFFGPHNLGAAGDSLIIWGRYLLDEVGFDAVRLDAIRHVEPGFVAPFLVELANGDQPFAIGEFFDGNAGAVAGYQGEVEQFVSSYGIGSKDANLAMFDFPLRFTLRDMANDLGGGFDMWNLNFRGLLLDGAASMDAEDIVTFIENHDTDRGGFVVVECPGDVQIGNTCLDYQFDGGHDPVVFDKEMAYAYIMAAEGTPTVFWKDWYWYHLDKEIKWQMALRDATAIGSTTTVQSLNPFSPDGLIGNDLFALRRNGTGSGADGAMLMLNDDPTNTYSFFLDSPAGWANNELKDYSDAYLFQSTQCFGDGRASYKCNARNYAWYAPTGLYPQTPGETPSAFTLGNHVGAKMHYVVLRASDAANLIVNGSPISPGDQVAIVPAGESVAVGLGRVGQKFTWDGVHDMIIEVLGGTNAGESNGGLINGEGFEVVVWDAGAASATTVTSITYAPFGTNFNFSADRPASRGGSAPFGLVVSHAAGTYLSGGITLITALNATTYVCDAGSNAAASAYNDGWQNGDNDGTGFGGWVLTTQNNNGSTGGRFISSSTTNGDGDGNGDGDINTGGRAWGMYANSGDVSNAIRPFTNALVPGAQFSLRMDNGWIDGGGTVGFGLQNSSGQNRFELFFRGGQANYERVDADGLQAISGAGFTDEGMEFTFTLTGVNTYTASLRQLINGAVYHFSGTLSAVGGSAEISRVRLFNANAGPDGQRNAFYNSLEICIPYCVANDPDMTFVEATTCDPDEVGTTEEVLTNRFGCDSIVTTETTLLPSHTTNVEATTCDPEQAGTTEEVFTNQYGCDSTVITTTTLLPSHTTYLDATTCDPDEVGTTEEVFTNQYGCDSTVITTTTLLPSHTTYLDATTCDPDEVGTTEEVFTNQYGCDSTVITTTTLLPSHTTYLDATTCDPDEVGTTEELFTNQYGCDSTVITTTTLLSLPQVEMSAECEVVYPAYPDSSCTTLSVTASDGTAPYSYAWTNDVDEEFLATTSSINVCPTANTIYTVVVTDANGCTATGTVEVKSVDISAGNNKVFVCHVSNGHTLAVNVVGIPNHLAHGDRLGRCSDPNWCAEYEGFVDGGGEFMPLDETGEMFTFYPNPVDDVLVVEFNGVEAGQLEVSVFNAQGVEMYAVRHEGIQGLNRMSLKVGSFVDGIYFVRMRRGEREWNGKFVRME